MLRNKSKLESILSVPLKFGSSYILRSIFKACDALGDGFQARLGDGKSSFWFFDWTVRGKLCNKVSYVHISNLDFLVENF